MIARNINEYACLSLNSIKEVLLFDEHSVFEDTHFKLLLGEVADTGAIELRILDVFDHFLVLVTDLDIASELAEFREAVLENH